MTVEMYAAYLAALMVVLLAPGPTALLVIGYALRDGRDSVWSTVPGVALGDLLAMTCSFAGLGAVLILSATLFSVLKWIGAAYLIYLGIKMWRAEPRLSLNGESGMRQKSGRAVLGHAFVVTALNPKSIMFFVAFLPQFISPQAPVLPQFMLLGGTFLVLGTMVAAGYGVLAGSLRQAIVRPATLRMVNRLGGGALVTAGLVTAALRRPN